MHKFQTQTGGLSVRVHLVLFLDVDGFVVLVRGSSVFMYTVYPFLLIVIGHPSVLYIYLIIKSSEFLSKLNKQFHRLFVFVKQYTQILPFPSTKLMDKRVLVVVVVEQRV